MNNIKLLALYGKYRLLCDEYGWTPSREGFNAFVKALPHRKLWAKA